MCGIFAKLPWSRRGASSCLITCQSEGWLRQSGNPQDVFFLPFPSFFLVFFSGFLVCFANNSSGARRAFVRPIPRAPAVFFLPILGYSSCLHCCCWQRKSASVFSRFGQQLKFSSQDVASESGGDCFRNFLKFARGPPVAKRSKTAGVCHFNAFAAIL